LAFWNGEPIVSFVSDASAPMETDRLSVFCCCAVRRNPLAQMEEERREHETKMKKMEQEMEQVFEMKVKEKTQKLKDSEADVSGQLTARGLELS
jgi:septin family protein